MISESRSCTAPCRWAGVAAGRLFELGRAVVKRLGNNGVHRHERSGDGEVGPHGAELEPVAGEGEGAGAVAVAGVLGERRERVDSHLERALGQRRIGAAAL